MPIIRIVRSPLLFNLSINSWKSLNASIQWSRIYMFDRLIMQLKVSQSLISQSPFSLLLVINVDPNKDNLAPMQYGLMYYQRYSIKISCLGLFWWHCHVILWGRIAPLLCRHAFKGWIHQCIYEVVSRFLVTQACQCIQTTSDSRNIFKIPCKHISRRYLL